MTNETIDLIVWLQNWYLKNCNGDWEHGDGIEISTLDNPGWRISIYLAETEMENIPFTSICIDRTEDNWLYCKVEKSKFRGACGALNLIEMLEVFRDWVILNTENHSLQDNEI